MDRRREGVRIFEATGQGFVLNYFGLTGGHGVRWKDYNLLPNNSATLLVQEA